MRDKYTRDVTFTAFSLLWHSLYNLYPARHFRDTQTFLSGFSSRPVLLAGKTRVISAKCLFSLSFRPVYCGTQLRVSLSRLRAVTYLSSRPVFNYCGKNAGYFGKEPFISDVYQASHPARLTLRGHDSQGLRPPTRLIFRGVLFLAKCRFTILENIVPCPSYSRDLESRDLLVTSYFAPAVLFSGFLNSFITFWGLCRS